MKETKIGKKALGTFAIAKICQVTPQTVGQWLREGKLPSFLTGGGHRRVWIEDLAKYLKSLNIPVPQNMVVSPKTTILIVDDESTIRQMVRRILKKRYPELDIYEASNGFEAGHKVTALVPSLLVLDVGLPGMDGYGICHLIRSNENLKAIKILAISGLEKETTGKNILASGADDFLAKPFESTELAEKVEKLIQIKSRTSEAIKNS